MKTNKRYYNEEHASSTAHPNVCDSAALLINQNNPNTQTYDKETQDRTNTCTDKRAR